MYKPSMLCLKADMHIKVKFFSNVISLGVYNLFKITITSNGNVYTELKPV
jgi:hypothetical protein